MIKPSINFSVLDSLPKVNLTFANVRLSSIIAYAPLGILPLVYLLAVVPGGTAFLLWIFILAGAISLIVLWIYEAQKKMQATERILEEFGRQNQFSFLHENKNIQEKGSLFEAKDSHSKYESRIITGDLGGYPLKLFDYHYETGRGKHLRRYDVRIARLTLPRKLPHMVIDCLVEEGEGQASLSSGGPSTLPIIFDDSQKIELEGDFYKFFSIYAPDKYAVSALTVIAPDAMEALLRMKSLCDIEIIDNYIYFYWPDETISREKYEEAFSTISEVMAEIGAKLSTGDIFATKDQAAIHASNSSNPVNLKKRNLGLAEILFILLLISTLGVNMLVETGIVPENSPLPPLIPILLGILFVLMFTYPVIKERQRRKLRQYLEQRYQKPSA